MNEFLASYYGTAGAGEQVESTESAEKTAQVELFAKLASENGIDLDSLPDAAVQQLWDATFSKTASDDNDEDDEDEDKKEKKAAAEAEFLEKKAASEKIAEADFLGRVMAHSYVQELDKIASAASATVKKVTPTRLSRAKDSVIAAKDSVIAGGRRAGKAVSEAASAGAGRAKELITGSRANAYRDTKAENTANFRNYRAMNVDKQRVDTNTRNELRAATKQHAKQHVADQTNLRNESRKVMATRGALGASAAGGAYLAGSKKESSAISPLDDLAIDAAIAKVAEAGFDIDEAAEKIAEVLILTSGEFTDSKVASASDVDQAVEIRSLELLEVAGYPVTWNF